MLEWLICRQWSDRLDRHELGETEDASNIQMAKLFLFNSTPLHERILEMKV